MNALQRAAKAAAKRAATVVAPHQAVFVIVADATANGGMSIATNRENLSNASVAIILRAMADGLAPAGEVEPEEPGADVMPIGVLSTVKQ